MAEHLWRGDLRAGVRRLTIAVAIIASMTAPAMRAQGRVGADSRSHRYVHDLLYGSLLGVAYAGVDQFRNDPPECPRDGVAMNGDSRLTRASSPFRNR